MSGIRSDARYNSVSLTLHWATVILVAAAYALMEFKGIFPKGGAGRNAMMALHYSVGATILAVTVARLPLRAIFSIPPIEPEPSRWQQSFARVMHWALYALLLILPITGWMALNASGSDLSVWGIHFPTLLSADKSFARSVKEVHETIAALGYWLIGLHALAALFHHYFLRDNTLVRMLPARTRQ